MRYIYTSNVLNNFPYPILLGILVLLLTIVAIHFAIYFLSAVSHKAIPQLSDKYENKDLQDDNRGEVDIRYVKAERGIWMLFHDNNQLITPNRATSLVYDHNDRSGSRISNMLVSNRASSVSVSIDGVMTRGFELGGLATGDIVNSKLINVRPLWIAHTFVHNNITTMGIPLPLYTNTWSIVTTNPVISSMRDDRGRDIRHNIDFII